MGFTVLERILWPERTRLRAARGEGFGVPVMHEHGMPGTTGPYLVTGATGRFLRTQRTSEGLVRCGLFPCTVAEEDAVVARMLDALQANDIRCTHVQDAQLQPKSVLMSTAMVAASGADAEAAVKVMGLQGHIGVVNGAQVVVTRAPIARMLWVGPNAGVYVRSGDHLGLILVLRAFLLVDP